MYRGKCNFESLCSHPMIEVCHEISTSLWVTISPEYERCPRVHPIIYTGIYMQATRVFYSSKQSWIPAILDSSNPEFQSWTAVGLWLDRGPFLMWLENPDSIFSTETSTTVFWPQALRPRSTTVHFCKSRDHRVSLYKKSQDLTLPFWHSRVASSDRRRC